MLVFNRDHKMEIPGSDMKTYIIATGLVLAVSTGGLFAADNTLTPQEKADGWVLLFDGKTLDGWSSVNTPPAGRGRGGPGGGGAPGAAAPARAAQAPQAGAGAPAVSNTGSNPKACTTTAEVPAGASHWEVVDGMLVPCGEPTGYLTSTADYKDFVLGFDFRAAADCNSGIFIRSAYEVQIWATQPDGYNTGSIVNATKPDKDYKLIADQWNHFEITADGDHMTVVLNGVKTTDIHDSRSAEGRFRLQYQKFPIEFKNLKLKPIQH
jgi:hypothetical protein